MEVRSRFTGQNSSFKAVQILRASLAQKFMNVSAFNRAATVHHLL